MNQISLSVVVPTYNRENQLKKLISRLIVLSKGVNFELIIMDNNSRIDLSSFFLEIMPNHISFQYIRRDFNIGLTANVLRSYEVCNRGWMIILSDDDDINDNFFINIYKYIKDGTYSNFSAIKFKTNLNPMQSECNISNIDEFLLASNTVKLWGAMALVSSWLFKVDSFKKYVKYSYIYSGLNLPHVTPVLFALLDLDIKLKLVEDSIVDWSPPQDGTGWDTGLVYSLIVNSSLVCPVFSDSNKLKLFINGVVGKGYKEILKFLLAAKFSLNDVSFKYVKSYIFTFGYRYKIIAFIFIFIQPFLRLSRVQKKLKLMFGEKGFERI